MAPGFTLRISSDCVDNVDSGKSPGGGLISNHHGGKYFTLTQRDLLFRFGQRAKVYVLSALYKFNVRSQRWYTVTLAVINAWNLYRRDQKNIEPQAETHGPVKVSGCCWYFSHKCKKGKNQVWLTTSLSRSRRKTSPQKGQLSVPPDVRKDDIDHFPTWET